MTAIPASRVNYFERQYLRLAEFRDEQAYHISIRRRHNLSHHSWGIVTGLEVVLEAGVPVVRPGLAVDGYGRELLLSDRFTIDKTMFDRYGTNRLDLWLEYDIAAADAGASVASCNPSEPRQGYRAIERARLTIERASPGPVEARRPSVVPPEAVDAILGDTPDDPSRRWPVYLGRLSMKIPEDGKPVYTVEPTSLAYIGLNAEIIDHPGNPSRIELGHASDVNDPDTRTVAGTPWEYEGNADREFAVFVPTDDPKTALRPTIAVYSTGTEIRGATVVHGNLILDGSSLVFADAVPELDAPKDPDPALYRVGGGGTDELRIDLGQLTTPTTVRKLVLGLVKDGEFKAALEISIQQGATPTVTVKGDLRVEGVFRGSDIRLRTLSQDLIPQLAGMLQMGILSGGP